MPLDARKRSALARRAPAVALLTLALAPSSALGAGLASPLKAPPTLNRADAGSEVSVGFDAASADAAKVFGKNKPVSTRASCRGRRDPNDNAVTAAALSAVTVDHAAGSKRYVYRWKTRQAWAGKCRVLRIKLADGTTLTARFRFEQFRFGLGTSRALNAALAPSLLPVKFRIDAPGSPLLAAAPQSRPVDCTTLAPTGPPTAVDGDGPVKAADLYTFTWRVPATFAGTCRQLLLRFTGFASSVQAATYRFTAAPRIPVIIDDGPVVIANRAPVATNDAGAGFATDEDTPFTTASLLANDSDPDGDPLTLSALSTGTLKGTATTGAAGKADYSPNAKFEALDGGQSDTDSFGYSVSDGRGGTATATATVTVNGVNDAPVATGGAATLAEDAANGAAVRTVTATDKEPGQTHTFSIVSGNAAGKFAINPTTGAITVADPLDFETTPSYSLGVRATDNGTPAKSGDTTVTVNVTNVNEAPVVNSVTTAPLPENSPNGTAVATVSASDPEADPLIYSIVGGNTGGAFTIGSSGAITVANSAALDFETTPSFTLTVKVTDTGGLFSQTVFQVDLTDVAENPPSASTGSALVAENALSTSTGALVTGTNPASTAEISTGNLTYSFGDQGPASTLPFSWGTGVTATDPEGGDPALGALKSNGNAVTWSVSPGGTTLTGIANAQTVFKAELTNISTGALKVTLLGQLDHPDANQSGANDQIRLAIPYTVKDAVGATAASTLNVSVNDDAPTQTASTVNLPTEQDTNLLLMLDVSGSQADASGATNLTYLDVMKDHAEDLIRQYDQRGDVAVRIVTYSATASAHGSTWESATSAIAFVRSLTAGGTSNFDAALTTAMSAFGSAGKISGAKNVSIFYAGGDANLPSGSEGINSSEEAAWTNFLTTNSIKSIAIGLGSQTTQSAINPIAYNGRTPVNTNGTVYTNLAAILPPDLDLDDVDPLDDAKTGNLLASMTTPGADQPAVLRSVTVGSKTYTYDSTADTVTVSGSGTSTHTFNAATNVIAITIPGGGTLDVDFDDGAYDYDPPAGLAASSESFAIGVRDADTDTASGTVTFDRASVDHPPLVRPDYVYTNITGAAGANVAFPETALLSNDADADGDALSVTALSNLSDGTSVARSSGTVTFTDNDADGGTFDYTAQAGALTGSADVVVDRQQLGETSLDGTGRSDILVARNSATTLNGVEGNDVLLGDAGADALNGMAGDDLLDGGGNADSFTGGQGDDTVDVSNGNDLVRYTTTLDGTDTLTSFDGAGGLGAQDQLTLDALFDSLAVAAASRAARVQVVSGATSSDVNVDADGSPGFELHVATLQTTDPISAGSGSTVDVDVGT